MALRLTQETRERWKKHEEEQVAKGKWRPVPRAEPAPEKEPEPSPNTFDIYSKTWVDT